MFVIKNRQKKNYIPLTTSRSGGSFGVYDRFSIIVAALTWTQNCMQAVKITQSENKKLLTLEFGPTTLAVPAMPLPVQSLYISAERILNVIKGTQFLALRESAWPCDHDRIF